MTHKQRRRLVMVVIDASRRDVFHENFDSGRLPNFRRIFGDGRRIENAVSMFPSVTIPCLATIFTGCHFKTHGITGNVWYDRSGPEIKGRAYMSVLDETVASFGRKQFGLPTLILPDIPEGGLLNNDIAAEARTIYEDAARAGLTSHSAFSYVGRGATRWLRPRRSDMLLYAMIDKLKFDYRRFDRRMVKVAARALNGGAPDIMALYFGGHDGYSHRHGPLRQHEYLVDTVDPCFGRFVAALERKVSGLDQVCFALTADHGQTEFPDAGTDIWTDEIEGVIKLAGLKCDGGETNVVDQSADVIYALGTGASFSLHVRNPGTDKWNVAPELERDLLPLARAFAAAADPGRAGTPGYIGDCLDFFLVRRGFEAPYMVYDHRADSLVELETFFSGRESEYPDAVARLRGIERQRSGDIICMLRYEQGWYMAGDYHAGNHGALNPRDSYIPMMFAGPGVKSGSLDFGRLIDFAPTAASLLGVEMPGADGVALPVGR